MLQAAGNGGKRSGRSGRNARNGRNGLSGFGCVLALVTMLALGPSAAGCRHPGPGWTPDVSGFEGAAGDQTREALYPVRYSGFARAWIRPGEHFAAYRTLLVAPPTITFEREPTHEDSWLLVEGGYPSEPNFALSERQLQDFGRYLVEEFRAELGASGQFELVDEPAADTLVVVPSVVDLVMFVPLGALPGGEQVITRRTAEMTLVVDLVDARSREVIARVTERRDAVALGASGVGPSYSSTTSANAAALRSTFRRWAAILRDRLDATHMRASSTGSSPS